jgi:hypothetical protein
MKQNTHTTKTSRNEKFIKTCVDHYLKYVKFTCPGIHLDRNGNLSRRGLTQGQAREIIKNMGEPQPDNPVEFGDIFNKLWIDNKKTIKDIFTKNRYYDPVALEYGYV